MKIQFLLSIVANVLRVVLGFLFFWQVSQALELSTLGEYLYVTAALGYFGTLIDYGFNLFVLNTASRSVGDMRSLFLRVILSKLVLTVLSVAVLSGLYGVAFAEQGPLITALFFLIVVLMSFSGLLIQFFKALGRFEHEFSSTLIASVLPVLALLVLHDGITLVVLGAIVLGVRIIVLAFQLPVFLRLTSGQTWVGDDKIGRRLLPGIFQDIRSNYKYAMFSVLGTVFLSIDIVMMRFLLGPEEISIYGTAMKVILAMILFFEVLHGTFTPRLARLHESRSEVLKWEVKRFYYIMGAMAAVCSAVAFTLGPPAITWAFGSEFEKSADLVRILALVFILRVAEMTTGPLLTIYGLQAFRAKVMIVVLPVHVSLNFLLQHQFGIEGAVAALAFSFLLIFALNIIYLRRNILID